MNAFIDSRNMLIRYNSTDNCINKLVSFSSFFRSDLDRYFSELTCTAGLLSVAITRISIASDRLTERNARLDNFYIDFISFLQSLDDNIKLQFTLSLNEDLIEFGVMNDDEGRIFLMQGMQSDADFFFISFILSTN